VPHGTKQARIIITIPRMNRKKGTCVLAVSALKLNAIASNTRESNCQIREPNFSCSYIKRNLAKISNQSSLIESQ
jgi:hypothetical protein